MLVAILALAAAAALWSGQRPAAESVSGESGTSPGSPGPGGQRSPGTSGPPEPDLAEGDPALPPLDPQTPDEVRQVVSYTRAADIGQLASLERMLAAEQPLVVGNAVRALGRLGLFTAGSKYAGLVADERTRVRAEAVRAFGMSGDVGAVPLLVQVLGSQDADLRPLAIEALGAIGGDAGLEALAAVQPRDRTEQVFLDQARQRGAAARRTSAAPE